MQAHGITAFVVTEDLTDVGGNTQLVVHVIDKVCCPSCIGLVHLAELPSIQLPMNP